MSGNLKLFVFVTALLFSATFAAPQWFDFHDCKDDKILAERTQRPAHAYIAPIPCSAPHGPNPEHAAHPEYKLNNWHQHGHQQQEQHHIQSPIPVAYYGQPEHKPNLYVDNWQLHGHQQAEHHADFGRHYLAVAPLPPQPGPLFDCSFGFFYPCEQTHTFFPGPAISLNYKPPHTHSHNDHFHQHYPPPPPPPSQPQAHQKPIIPQKIPQYKPQSSTNLHLQPSYPQHSHHYYPPPPPHQKPIKPQKVPQIKPQFPSIQGLKPIIVPTVTQLPVLTTSSTIGLIKPPTTTTTRPIVVLSTAAPELPQSSSTLASVENSPSTEIPEYDIDLRFGKNGRNFE